MFQWANLKSHLHSDENNLKNLNLLFNSINPIIECKDYKYALDIADENDFIYLDPPYKPTSETSYFTKYTNLGFGDTDQRNLAKIVEDLDKRKCKILLRAYPKIIFL
jgi:DNA adenine methylase